MNHIALDVTDVRQRIDNGWQNCNALSGRGSRSSDAGSLHKGRDIFGAGLGPVARLELFGGPAVLVLPAHEFLPVAALHVTEGAAVFIDIIEGYT